MTTQQKNNYLQKNNLINLWLQLLKSAKKSYIMQKMNPKFQMLKLPKGKKNVKIQKIKSIESIEIKKKKKCLQEQRNIGERMVTPKRIIHNYNC